MRLFGGEGIGFRQGLAGRPAIHAEQMAERRGAQAPRGALKEPAPVVDLRELLEIHLTFPLARSPAIRG
jgi:hypothetical protein